MPADPAPVISAFDDAALAETHSIVIEPWPGLRWVHIGQQRIAVSPDPDLDLSEATRALVQTFRSQKSSDRFSWEGAAEIAVRSLGVGGLLAEIARLHNENAALGEALSILSADSAILADVADGNV